MQPDPTAPIQTVGFSWRYRDHTRGSLLASMLVLALPSIGTSLAGAAVYQLIDLKFVSSLGAAPLAAVVVTNQTLRQAAFLLVMSTSLVAQMMMARFVGEGSIGRAEHVAGQILVLGASFCVLFALVGSLFSEELLRLVARDPEVLREGVPYVRLIFLLMFGFVLVPLFGAILSGAGDSTTPLLITLLAAPVSLFAEWCLIFGHLGAPALGISGVAVGAMIGSLIGVSFGLWILLSGRCRIHLRPQHFVPDLRAIGQIMRVVWQPALHLAGRTLTVIYFMVLAGRFSAEAQAAFGIGIRLELVVFMIAFPIANASATLVGQNLGAGQRRRAWRAIAGAMALSTGVCWTAAGLVFFLRHEFLGLFSQDPEVLRVGSEYLLFTAGSMLLIGLYFVAFRALQGAGDMTAPMLISNGTTLLVTLPLGHFLALHTELGLTGLWIAMLAASGLNTGLTLGWLARGRWTGERQNSFISPQL